MKKTLTSLAFAAALPLLAGSPAFADTYVFTNAGNDSALDNGGDWDPPTVTNPGTTDEAVIDNSEVANPFSALTLTSPQTYGDLILNSNTLTSLAAGAGTTNAVLTLSGGGGSTAAIGAGGATGDLVVLGSNVTGTVSLGGATTTGKLSIALGTNGNFDVVNSSAILTMANSTSGAFTLTKTGAGQLYFQTTNTFTNLTIADGIVASKATTGAFGTGTITLGANDGLNNSASLFTSAGSVTYTNNIVVQAGTTGTLTIENGDAPGDSTTVQNNIFSGAVALNNNLTLVEQRSARTLTLSGTITGSSTITVQGTAGISSIVALTGNSATTFTGNVVINSGALSFGSNSLGQNSTGGTITFANSGTMGLTWSGVNTQDISGRLQALTGTASVTLDPGSNNITFASTNGLAGGVSNTYTKKANSAGILTLAAANSFAGTYTADTIGGSTLLANANALQNATVNLLPNITGTPSTGGITFDSSVASHAFTFGDLSGTTLTPSPTLPNLVLQDNGGNAVALTVGGNNTASTTYMGSLSGSGSFAKVGTGILILSGINTFTGATSVIGGQLTLNSSGTDSGTSSYLIRQGTFLVDNSGTVVAGRLAKGNMTLQDGTFNLTGKSAAGTSTSETIGTLTLDSGDNSITLTQGSGTGSATTLTAGSLVRNNNAVLFVRGSGGLGQVALGTGPSTYLTLTANPTGLIGGGGSYTPGNSSTISIIPYLVGANSATAGPTTFIGYDPTNNSLRALKTTEFLTLPTVVTTTTSNVRNSVGTTSGAIVGGSTFNSLILDEISPTGTVTYTLGGSLTLSSGAFLASRSATSGTNRDMILTGGTIQAASGVEDVFTDAIGANLFINSQISGSGGLTLNTYVNNTVASTIVLGSTSNNYTGTTTINGDVKLGTSNVIPDASTVSVGAGGVFDLNGNSESIDALSGSGTVDTTLATNASTLMVGASNGSGTFSGVVQNTGATGATLAVAKTGTGAETFTGSNTYSGGTAISNGVLYANSATGSSTGTGMVTVTSGGTLAGLGHIAPLGSNGISVNGGMITPGGVQTAVPLGGTPGTVANGSLTIDTTNTTAGTTVLSLTNATLTFALGAGGANSGSQIVIGGANAAIVNFNASNNVVTINDLIGTGLSSGTEYTLIDGASNTTFSGLTFGTFVAGKGQLITGGLSLLAAGTPGNDFADLFGTSQLYYNNGDIVVDVEGGTAVPEPGIWALMVGGLALLIVLQRRKGDRV